MKTRKSRKTNPRIPVLVRELNTASRAQKANIWKVAANTLSGPISNQAEINLTRLSRVTKANDIVLVPGKVLGTGILEHPVKVYALNFSESAKKQIGSAKGKCGTIEDLLKENPKGNKIKLIR